MKNILLVGDMFSMFTKYRQGTKTFSTFLASGNNINEIGVLCGQGLSLANINTLNIKNIKILNHENIKLEKKRYVHKKNKENVIITTPQAITTENFLSYMFINEKLNLLDHITGIHIPGMLIAEGARQMLLSVGDRYYNTSSKKNRYTIVSLKSDFYGFLFPEPIEIFCEISNLKINLKKDYLKGTLRAHFIQNKCKRATTEIIFLRCSETKAISKEIKSYKELFQNNANF